jgi:PAS domain S-box-containing protein
MRMLGSTPFRQFFENSPLAMWIYDLADLKFLAVNKAACRQYGYQEQEFLALMVRGTILDGTEPPSRQPFVCLELERWARFRRSKPTENRLQSGEISL